MFVLPWLCIPSQCFGHRVLLSITQDTFWSARRQLINCLMSTSGWDKWKGMCSGQVQTSVLVPALSLISCVDLGPSPYSGSLSWSGFCRASGIQLKHLAQCLDYTETLHNVCFYYDYDYCVPRGYHLPWGIFKSRWCQRICGILGHRTPNQSKMLLRKNLSFPLLNHIFSVGAVFFSQMKVT